MIDEDDEIPDDVVDPIVRRVAELLPFATELFADMGGPTMLQIDLGRRGGQDDPPDSASIDPTVRPTMWTFDVEGGRETVVSTLGIDATPESVAEWIVTMARHYGSPAARSTSHDGDA